MQVTARSDFDPATLDVATAEHYERNGYPHAEWTWLRQHDPVFWYERPNVDPFWAITKHADIIEIGKQPELFLNAPRLAVFTQRPAAAARRRRRAISSTWIRPTTPATGASPATGSRRAPSRHGRQGRARHPRGARRRGREAGRRLRPRHLGAHHDRRDRRDARRAAPATGSCSSAGRTRSSRRRIPSSSTRHAAGDARSGARMELFTYFNDLVERAPRASRPTTS